MNPQGSSFNLQGGSGASLQGSAPTLQGSTPQLQTTSPALKLQGSSPNLQGNNPAPAQTNSAGSISPLLAQDNALSAQTEQLIQRLEQQLANKPVAPTLNLNSIKANALSAAQNTVNPLYTQQLNQYLQNEAAAQQQQQQQNTMNIQGYQSSETNTLAQNQIAQQNAIQENAGTQANINTQASNYQLNSGNSQTQKMAAINASVGQGGLTGSGLGSQQLWQAENLRNIEDAQQQGQFQFNRNVANLAANTTFADLAQSSQFAKTQEGQQEAQSNFNLNSYLRQSSYEQQQYEEALTAWQQQAIGAQQQNNIASGVTAALQPYTNNPGVYSAGIQAYAPQLQTATGPSMINPLNYQP